MPALPSESACVTSATPSASCLIPFQELVGTEGRKDHPGCGEVGRRQAYRPCLLEGTQNDRPGGPGSKPDKLLVLWQ